MSHNSNRAASDAPQIDTTPALPRPSDSLVNAAARVVPEVLYSDDHGGMQADFLTKRIEKRGHPRAAGQWAIHALILGSVDVDHDRDILPMAGVPWAGPLCLLKHHIVAGNRRWRCRRANQPRSILSRCWPRRAMGLVAGRLPGPSGRRGKRAARIFHAAPRIRRAAGRFAAKNEGMALAAVRHGSSSER